MKNFIYVLLSTFCLLVGYELNESRTKEYTIEDYMSIPSYHPASISKDNSTLLLSSSVDGFLNIYEITLADNQMRQLTFSKKEALQPLSYFPNDKRFLFSSDGQGDEINHLFVQNLDGSQKDLTPFPGVRSSFVGWNRDKSGFYLTLNKRDNTKTDLYEMDLENYSLKEIFLNDGDYSLSDISEDGRLVALTKTLSPHNSNIYIYDRETKEFTLVTPHKGDVQYNNATFTKDGKTLLFLTDENSEFTYIATVDLSTKEISCLIQKDWDIEAFGFSENEKYLILSLNEDGTSKIHVYQYETLTPVIIPQMQGLAVSSFKLSKDETFGAISLNSPTSPSQIYLFDMGGTSLKPLTKTESVVPLDRMVEARIIRYPSFDGLQIPAILYTPKQQFDGQKFPALLWAHGGPGGQTTVGWNPQFQFLINEGYAILAVNNRGSSGYGKTFFAAADKKHGDVDLRDYIAAKEYLKTLNEIDGERIGIIGGSYGGYLVLAALAFHPGEFTCGVDIFGVSNWVRTLSNLPPWWTGESHVLHNKIGHPETDLDYLISISPLFHAEKIQKPLLVLQGANDPRVVKQESDEIVEKVKANQVSCDYILFEDEGHGFTKKANRIHAWDSIKNFLNEHLRGIKDQ